MGSLVFDLFEYFFSANLFSMGSSRLYLKCTEGLLHYSCHCTVGVQVQIALAVIGIVVNSGQQTDSIIP